MPPTQIIFYREEHGGVPLLDWLDGLPDKARLKCLARLQRLEMLGHELRRPEADYLRDGIYELRASFQESTTECSTSFTRLRQLLFPMVRKRSARYPRLK